jgi:hypothetical protein
MNKKNMNSYLKKDHLPHLQKIADLGKIFFLNDLRSDQDHVVKNDPRSDLDHIYFLNDNRSFFPPKSPLFECQNIDFFPRKNYQY